MKKLFLLSLLILVTQSFISCTADALPDNSPPQTITAADTGGQSGPITVPVPKL